MEVKRIAEVLYNLGCDMDYMDYADNIEDSLTDIEYSIELIRTSDNENIKNLFYLLEQIALANEDLIIDFVERIRGANNGIL